MKKFNKYIKLILFVFMFFIFSSIVVHADAYKIQKVETKIDENGKITFNGTTVGSTDNMSLLVKIYNEDSDGEYTSLEFFDQIYINGNDFSFTATPMNAKEGDTLKISITGDLTYSGTFYYSKKYSSFIEQVEDESINLLEKYAIYYDDVIPTKLKFDIDMKYNGKVVFVYLKGTNFKEADSNWQNKDSYTWDIFLSTICTKEYQLSKGSTVYVYVYDRNGKLLQCYPEEANNAVNNGNNSSNNNGNNSGNNGSSSGNNGNTSTGGDNNSSSNVSEVITQKDLDELLKDCKTYSSHSYKYSYEYTLINATSTYIKIKAKGNFNKKDDSWVYVDTTKLEAFFDMCATKIKNKYNADIDFIIYSSDDNILTSYNYYTYSKNPTTNDSSNSSSSSSSSSNSSSSSSSSNSSSSSSSSSSINENYTPDNGTVDKVPDIYELDEDYQFVPWNDKRATGLVLALYLANYGSNSTMIVPIVNEGTTNGKYLYELTTDKTTVDNALNSLRNDSQKIVYIKKQTDTNNLNLLIPSDVVSSLKASGALFILDTDYYKTELDFSKFNGNGTITIKTSDVDMSSDDYAKPLNLSIKLDGQEATNYFDNGIKCLIHYESEKTKTINDLRSINVYNSKGIMFNSTATTLEKGFIFKYDGTDTYYAKNNQYVFTDEKKFEDKMVKRYAELVVSKGIMDGTNNGAFNPSETITRGDFILFLANKMGAFSTTQHFNNLPSSNPYFTAVNGIYELGILPSSFRKNLDINKTITREEMIYMVVRCYEINNNNSGVTSASLLYKDKSEISTWAKSKIGMASKLGLIEDDGYLYPKDDGDREFAAELLYNLLVAEKIF